MKSNDALSRLVERVNLIDLLNAHCPTPETARLNRDRGGLIRDPRPGCEEHHPSFSVSRSGGVWLWHRFGRADDRGREEGGNAYHLLIGLGFDHREVVAELERFVEGVAVPAYRPVARAIKQRVIAKPIADQTLEVLKRVQTNLGRHWPIDALTVRGITLGLAQMCGLGWETDGSIVIPIAGPDGRVLNIKQRQPEGSSDGRYRYLNAGNGAPAWCNPGFGKATSLLLCEGELNGLVAWGAAQAVGLGLDVQGLAGANGKPHIPALEHRRVFVYADADDPGRRAVERWANLARASGALEVVGLEPLPAPFDFCDLAGRDGLEALGKHLRDLMRNASSFPPKPDFTPEAGEKTPRPETPPFVSRQRTPGLACSNS
jgi:putative DNA primase/helicase